jgi:hypothetical protein
MIWHFVLVSASVIALTAASSAASSQTLTCAQVNGGVGCCAGNVVHYCQSGVVRTQTCTGDQVCGWDGGRQDYSCVPPPAQAGGGQPMACPAPVPAPTCAA